MSAPSSPADLYKTGHEYEDIGATWDWQRLPGTTVQVNGTGLNCSTSDSQGVLPNVGGVTDGYIGMAYMVRPQAESLLS